MEHLKNAEDFPFVHPQAVSVRQFIQSWTHILAAEELTLSLGKNQDERDAADLGVPLPMLKSLKKDLKANTFCYNIEEDHLRSENLDKLAATVELETLKRLHEHNEQTLDSSTYRMMHCPKYRHEVLNRPTGVAEVPDSRSPPLAVLTVQIFKPAVKSANRARLCLDREFQVLSSQSLSLLRDSYLCVSDVLTGRDYSDNPLELLTHFESHEKMGFFFIDNTFYSDSRCDNATFPKQIIKWAEERQVGHFSEKSMQTSQFEDLTIHLGFPYLYLHANNCEHLLVFTDIQMLIGGTARENPAIGYPRCTALESMQKVKCQMCRMCFSKWLVLNNRRLPQSPFFFCHNCFMSFNYDDQCHKRGSFQAYPILFNLDR